jgi:hypothetical protein
MPARRVVFGLYLSLVGTGWTPRKKASKAFRPSEPFSQQISQVIPFLSCWWSRGGIGSCPWCPWCPWWGTTQHVPGCQHVDSGWQFRRSDESQEPSCMRQSAQAQGQRFPRGSLVPWFLPRRAMAGGDWRRRRWYLTLSDACGVHQRCPCSKPVCHVDDVSQ